MKSICITFGNCRLLRAAAVIAVLLSICLSAPAQVQRSDDDEACLTGSGDLRVDRITCSRAIMSSAQPGYTLAGLYAARGRAYHYLRQPDNALADLNQALALNPGSAFAHNIRGLIQHNRGEYDLALDDYDAALALNPNFDEVYRNQGISYYFKGDTGKAREAFDFAISQSAYEPESAAFRGFLNYRERRYRAAAADFRRLQRQAYPFLYTEVWLYLARARAGFPAPETVLETTLEQAENNAWPGSLHEFMLGGRTEHEVLAAAGKVAPPDGSQVHQAYFYIAQLHALRGDKDAALAAFRSALENASGQPVLTVEAFNAGLYLSDR